MTSDLEPRNALNDNDGWCGSLRGSTDAERLHEMQVGWMADLEMENYMEELVYPYCGGCGHRFFDLTKVTQAEAEDRAKTTKCHYCLDDEREAKQSQKKLDCSDQGW
jgi:hypothetical protein